MRKLDASGEYRDKIVYRLIDLVQYRSLHVLVVGGGDSTLEAATTAAAKARTTVSLSYPSEAFLRAKARNRRLVEEVAATRKLRALFQSSAKSISEDDGTIGTLPKNAVVVSAGSILRTIGTHVETWWGTE